MLNLPKKLGFFFGWYGREKFHCFSKWEGEDFFRFFKEFFFDGVGWGGGFFFLS
jgi:hypothetical protein